MGFTKRKTVASCGALVLVALSMSNTSFGQPPPAGAALETLVVPAGLPNGPDGVISATVLEAGRRYWLLVQGTWTYAFSVPPADAEWYWDADNTVWREELAGGTPDYLELLVDGAARAWWGSCLASPDPIADFAFFAPHVFGGTDRQLMSGNHHTYWLPIVGDGATIHLRIHDTQYVDNTGSLSVSIYAAQCEDLNLWTDEGCPTFEPPAWTVRSGGCAIEVLGNANDSAFWINGFDVMNKSVTTAIRVEGNEDNDFIGLAIGLDSLEYDDPDAKYLLLVWRKGPQGMDLLSVYGERRPADPCPRFGGGPCDICPPFTGPCVLVAEANMGAQEWVHGETYVFDIRLTLARLTIFVDGALEFDIVPSDVEPGATSFDTLLGGGGFAFFNGSQRHAVYLAPYVNNDCDDDGVCDMDDVCPCNRRGLAVGRDGRPRLDLNNDCEVNGLDIALVVQQMLGL